MHSPASRPGAGPGPSRPGRQLSLLREQPETAIRIHASNRLETLAARLADRMRREPADPLEPERIVVPDPLLGQWLRLELATHLGVAAHLRVELPAEFAWAAMREEVQALSGQSVYGPPYLRWRIFDRLANWAGDDEIARYLEDGDARKRFELANQLAVAYDRCRVYRPEAIRAWQGGSEDGWHARLWADLAASDTEPRHWVDAIDRYRNALGGRPADAPRKRVSFLHVATLSPTYVEALRLAATAMDIHLYLLSPTLDFWIDPRPGAVGDDGENGNGEVHGLLDAWGRTASDLREQLRAGPGAAVVVDRPAATDVPHEGTCLAAAQRDLLGASPHGDAGQRESLEPDATIQIHVCHSPTREIEVLHDRLLRIFEDNDDIQPADVLILTPNLDTYAPLIEAVFGSAGRIRFSIGRQRLREGAALAAFIDLLTLPGGRYTANDVLGPLLAEAVRACFRISDTDLATLRGAVARSRIRWGLTDDHRTDLDVPASGNHNWRRGLDRLLLGYAMEEADLLIDGIAPSPLDQWGHRGGAADYELFGRFHRYCELAAALDRWKEDERDAAAWAERLRTEILKRFFPDEPHRRPETAREINTVYRLIEEFEEECRRAGNTGPIPFPVLRDVLKNMAAEAARSAPRLDDGVAVADLASGQIFPARVVCTVGMNDRAFPRNPPPDPFDFQVELFEGDARQPGDRDRRNEDRFAFLEALLAARRFLLLTHTGRDLQEDRPIPPSVVVSELLDYLHERFPGDHGDEADPWIVKHPLQPFSRRYFQAEEPALFSYSKSMLQAARALEVESEEPRRFKGKVPPNESDALPREIELEDLVRLSASPSKQFLRDRLGMLLATRDEEVANDEPLDLDALQTWQLKSDLSAADDEDAERTIELAAARGLLPTANLGRVQHREAAAQVAELTEALKGYQEHLQAPALGLDIELGDVRLVGAPPYFHQQRNELLFWRIGSLRAKDRIATWLRLLAAISARDRSADAVLFGCRTEVEQVVLAGPEPDEARALLGGWIEIWRDSGQRPLPFFASTSWTRIEKGAGHASILKTWSDTPWSEGNTPHHRLIFGDDPQDEDGRFDELAVRLLRPLRKAENDGR